MRFVSFLPARPRLCPHSLWEIRRRCLTGAEETAAWHCSVMMGIVVEEPVAFIHICFFGTSYHLKSHRHVEPFAYVHYLAIVCPK